MNSLVWLFLSAATAVSLLPGMRMVRAHGLVAGGRLDGVTRRLRFPAVGSRALPTRVSWVFGVLWVGAVVVATGPALGVAAAAVAWVAVKVTRDVLRSRRDGRRRRALATAVRLLSAELAAGAAPDDALVAAAATDDDARLLLGAAAEAARSSGDAAAVLAASDDPALRGLGVAWRLAASGGAALAEVVDRVASDLAARETARRAVDVAVAGPRSSAVLLSGLPLLGVALGVAMGAGPVAFLLGDSIGRVVCSAGVVLDVAGVVWLRRIVRSVRT